MKCLHLHIARVGVFVHVLFYCCAVSLCICRLAVVYFYSTHTYGSAPPGPAAERRFGSPPVVRAMVGARGAEGTHQGQWRVE